jgi:hypothetical protein
MRLRRAALIETGERETMVMSQGIVVMLKPEGLALWIHGR